jgi:NAD(P)-dependent dehydrogenase (short-subunit alcohol dehydrogenase family)
LKKCYTFSVGSLDGPAVRYPAVRKDIYDTEKKAMPHPAMTRDNVAVITGGASGIGLAAAMHFAALGMKVCIADIGDDALKAAEAKLSTASPSGSANIMTAKVDVSRRDELTALEAAVQKRFGGTDILMNNAGISPGTKMFGPLENWQRLLAVNLWGVIHGTQVFAPHMIERGRPGLIINTGSKQGITTPPGEPAYNVSKAGVKAFTEALQHELRNTQGCRISAHLLIPGHVFTGLTARGRTEKPPGAWTPEQTVDFMIKSLEAGDFYILCPDNDVPRSLDERRMLWAIGDIVENRPALSRWHPDYAEAFAAFARKG